MTPNPEGIIKKPPVRKLRGYAFDPSLSLKLETAQVNNITYKIEWEDIEMYPGSNRYTVPKGEYVEIVDYDPATGCFYDPVDLNDRYILAQDGLEPSVSNPQFHQQMVYAVLMTTIKNFESALGRKVQWATRLVLKNGKLDPEFVARLRVYPHGLRQSNAYYNPLKKSLLFGYFPAQPAQPQLQLPGGTVFTCLSHDIIAHETTHAMLDGLHRRYIEPTHPDTRAFHEAFADLVALFQHFTFPEVLKHQIARTKGDLAAQNLLGELAQEFGKAMGNYGSLRDAIGFTDPLTGEWKPHQPDPREYATRMEFHERGAILVAAVFDAFLSIYKRKIKKLLRVATNGSGVLPEGDLHPDLVDLLANHAADTASRVLRICVRAVDYCPPVDVTFGDFLRAIITADYDMVADDENNYRIAFIEAFQKRGIFPSAVKTMSVESLLYEQYPEFISENSNEQLFVEFLRAYKEAIAYKTDRKEIYELTKEFISGGPIAKMGLHARINNKFLKSAAGGRFADLTGLVFTTNKKQCLEKGFTFSARSGTATYAIENLWLASRITPNDRIVNHVIVTLSQKRGVRAAFDAQGNFKIKGYFQPNEDHVYGPNDFIFRGGASLIFDLDTMKLKYAIKKDISDEKRMEQQFRYTKGMFDTDNAATYFDDNTLTGLSGPFAFMHTYSHNH
jgi:hypothetical protein